MGFHDSSTGHMSIYEHEGVWVFDSPPEINERADGDTLLTLKIPADLFGRYEWIEKGNPTAKR